MPELDRTSLEELFRTFDLPEFRWMPAEDIEVAQWVRMKCIFGCEDYGKNIACPPNAPPVADCERFLGEFSDAVVFRFAKSIPDSEKRKVWSRGINSKLLELEREVFLLGYQKAFILLMGGCPLCEECVSCPDDCRHPGSARPTAEGLAVDLFSTVRKVGYPLEVLRDQSEPMNRYAILLVQ